MATTYSSALQMALNVTETFDSTTMPFVSGSQAQVIHSGIDKTITLTATSTPPISKIAAGQKALAAGVGTIDLTAVVHNGVAISLTGLKLVAFKFRNPSTNTGVITVTKGAASGYTLFGATFTIPIKPGGEVAIYLFTAGDAVAAGVKTIDMTGTGTESLDYLFEAG